MHEPPKHKPFFPFWACPLPYGWLGLYPDASHMGVKPSQLPEGLCARPVAPGAKHKDMHEPATLFHLKTALRAAGLGKVLKAPNHAKQVLWWLGVKPCQTRSHLPFVGMAWLLGGEAQSTCQTLVRRTWTCTSHQSTNPFSPSGHVLCPTGGLVFTLMLRIWA